MNNKPTYEELELKIRKLEKEATARIEALISLEETNERFSSLVENASDLIHSVTPAGKFLYVNQAWKTTLGFDDDDIKKLTLMDIVDESCRDKCRCIFNSLIQGGNNDSNETIFVARNGRKIVVEGRCSTKFVDGKARAMTGIFRDITSRSQTEKALRESEKRYRDLFENAHDLIQIVRPDGTLLYVNKSWRETFGYDEAELAGLSIFDLISPECQNHCVATFQKVISEEKVNYINTTFVAKNGRKVIIEGNAICKFENNTPVSTQCIFRDVTEKKKMEEELFKAQKLESVGIFAGGIAHDFNNLLTGILGNISVAKMFLNPEDKVYERLEATEKATIRATRLTHQLLTFAKGGAPVKKTASITELITDSTRFALRGSKVKLDCRIAENLWPIQVDEGQLSQVMQNLAINADQSMPSGGTVTIRAENKMLDGRDLITLPKGKYVKISVQDQGHGITEEHLSKIFDPYFSNKKGGSGLGLSIAYSIVKNHGGMITVESTINKGTLFTIYLPATTKKIIAKTYPAELISHGKGKILIMDDEVIIREVAAEMLSSLGFTTESACDGTEAIILYKKAMETNSPFDAVLMDLTIPGGMGGKETIAELLKIDPDVKAVVSSGYSNDTIMAHYKEYGFCGVVPKPYKVHEVARVLSETIKKTT